MWPHKGGDRQHLEPQDPHSRLRLGFSRLQRAPGPLEMDSADTSSKVNAFLTAIGETSEAAAWLRSQGGR